MHIVCIYYIENTVAFICLVRYLWIVIALLKGFLYVNQKDKSNVYRHRVVSCHCFIHSTVSCLDGYKIKNSSIKAFSIIVILVFMIYKDRFLL